MAKGRKPKKSVNTDVEVYRHEKDTRKNAVPVGLASYDTAKPKPKKYEYDPHLDPQLVWAGKKEHTSFEVPTVSLHIHERIAPEAIIRSIKREEPQIDFSQAFFPDSSAWDKLKRALKASIDEDKFELLTSTRSLPFKLGKENRIAVKVIDHRGNEVMVVREVG